MLILKKRLQRSKRTGLLEVNADFGTDEVIFHPLPKNCQEKYKEGQRVIGHFGLKHETGKKDKREVPIWIQYFIPEEVANVKNSKHKPS